MKTTILYSDHCQCLEFYPNYFSKMPDGKMLCVHIKSEVREINES